MDYQLLRDNMPERLNEKVNSNIAAGWTPLGGPVVFPCSDGRQYLLQAMTRARKHPESRFLQGTVGVLLLADVAADEGANLLGYCWGDCPDATAATMDATGQVRFWYGKTAPCPLLPIGLGSNPADGHWTAMEGVAEVDTCDVSSPMPYNLKQQPVHAWTTTLRRRPTP